MNVRSNVWGIDGKFGRDEFMWEDLEVASSDSIDPNLMEYSVLITEGGQQADNPHT